MKLHIQDLAHEYTGLSIDMSYNYLASVLSIRFNTPFGIIDISPNRRFQRDMYSFDIDNVTDMICDGLENRLPKIETACMEPLFSIEIILLSDCKTYFFTMELDVGMINKDITRGSAISITMTLYQETILEFVSFLRDIKRVRGRDDLE